MLHSVKAFLIFFLSSLTRTHKTIFMLHEHGRGSSACAAKWKVPGASQFLARRAEKLWRRWSGCRACRAGGGGSVRVLFFFCFFGVHKLSALVIKMKHIIISMLRGRRNEMSSQKTGTLAVLGRANWCLHANSCEGVVPHFTHASLALLEQR